MSRKGILASAAAALMALAGGTASQAQAERALYTGHVRDEARTPIQLTLRERDGELRRVLAVSTGALPLPCPDSSVEQQAITWSDFILPPQITPDGYLAFSVYDALPLDRWDLWAAADGERVTGSVQAKASDTGQPCDSGNLRFRARRRGA